MIKDIEEKNESVSICDSRLDMLKEAFPSCFNQDGTFDFEKFRSEISTKVDVIHEGYELKFLGKSYAKLLASLDTTTVLKPNKEHNSKPESRNSQNLYISGDNLDGLKHLVKSYSREAKCIYIDPPYNTGSDGFIYNDSFNFSPEELQSKLSIDENEAERILNMTHKGSASHSAWLLFMYPRLQLARNLLTNDGVIFLSIDDNELANLKILCDDVFGEENFVGQWNWFKSATPPNLSKKIKKNVEYILCYQRRKNDIKFTGLNKTSSSDDPITKPQNSEKDLIFPPRTLNVSLPDGKVNSGIYGTKKYPNHLKNDLIVECGMNKNEVTFNNRFTWTQPKLEAELLKNTRMNLSKNLVISYKKEDYDAEVPPNFIDKKVGVNTTENAGKVLTELFDNTKVFDYPKPVSLIRYLINFIADEGDLIIDFFGGSASTAESVMLENAEGKNLRYILVQLPENLEDTYRNSSGQKKSNILDTIDFLKENDYPLTLDYVGIERIKRAARNIKPKKGFSPDLGFKHFLIEEPKQLTLDKCDSFDKSNLIGDSTILEDFGVDTVLTTWLNYDGYGMNPKYEVLDLKGYEAYFFQKHLYLVNPGLGNDSIMKLIEIYEERGDFNPENLILFGYSFNEWSVTEMLEKNLKTLNDSVKNLKINISTRY